MIRRTRPDGQHWFPADVHLLDTKTGERRVYLTWESNNPEHGGLGGLEFSYSDGNDACDCNRADWFALAGDEREDSDARCGDGRYVVEKVIDAQDGRTLYSENVSAS